MGPGKKSNRGARKASMITECSDAPSRRIGQEFDIIQNTASTSKTGKVAVPIFLSLVAMAELYMVMLEGSFSEDQDKLEHQ